MNTKIVTTLIEEIVTRYSPNLEVGFLAALIECCLRVRRGLGITWEELSWKFISTASSVKNPDGNPKVMYFNTGGGQYDQHGKQINQSLSRKCSLKFVQDKVDFIALYPWLSKVYQAITDNDESGKNISTHPYNLRKLVVALSSKYRKEPQLILNWLTMAFGGIFENAKKETPIGKAFNPEVIRKGVVEFLVPQRQHQDDPRAWLKSQTKLKFFDRFMEEAITIIDQQKFLARMVANEAEKNGQTVEVYNKPIGKKIKIIEVDSELPNIGAVARGMGYHIVIQRHKDGHYQIHGGQVDKKKKIWLHLGELARRLRHRENTGSGKLVKMGQDWTKSGFVCYEDGSVIPWNLPEYKSSIYNGTDSSNDVPPTTITPEKLFQIVAEEVAKTSLIIREQADGQRIVRRVV